MCCSLGANLHAFSADVYSSIWFDTTVLHSYDKCIPCLHISLFLYGDHGIDRTIASVDCALHGCCLVILLTTVLGVASDLLLTECCDDPPSDMPVLLLSKPC